MSMDQVAVLVPSRVCVQPKEVVVVWAQDVFPSRIDLEPKEVVAVGAQETVGHDGHCLSLVSEELAQAVQQSHERPHLETC